MIDFIKISDSCISILGVVFFIREIIKIALFTVPIFLIVVLTLDFTKGIITFDLNDDKTLKHVTKRIVYAVVMLLIPVTVFGSLKAIGLAVTDSESCWAYVDENSTDDIKAKINANQKKLEKDTKKTFEKIVKKSKLTAKDKEKTRQIINSSQSTSESNNDNVDATNVGAGDGNITLDWQNLSKISRIESAAKLTQALNKTKHLKKWSPYAQALYVYERKYNVNLFFLIGLQAHESGFMSSPISKECNNLGGVQNEPTCPGHSPYRKFQTKTDFIKYHAKLLGNNYIKKGKKSLGSIKNTYCGSGCGDWIPGTKTYGNEIYTMAKYLSKKGG
ncbi:MAG: glucosaminidase domain-containing protein [Bacilli bacterium]|nr:glucosaminidase domain-containing protein [Bacilli bacterium]